MFSSGTIDITLLFPQGMIDEVRITGNLENRVSAPKSVAIKSNFTSPAFFSLLLPSYPNSFSFPHVFTALFLKLPIRTTRGQQPQVQERLSGIGASKKQRGAAAPERHPHL